MPIPLSSPQAPRLMPSLTAPGEGPEVPWVLDQLHLTLVRPPFNLERSPPITDSDLLAWDRPFMDLLHDALLHLREGTSADQLKPVDTVPGMLRVSAPDGLAASRMLCLADLLSPWPIHGAVVGVPTHAQLLVVPLSGLHALTALRALLLATWRISSDAVRPLSNQLFWIHEEGCVHLPVTAHPKGVSVDPPPELIEAISELTSLGLTRVAGEA